MKAIKTALQEAKSDPAKLVGWRVEVLGHGTGLIKGVEKSKKVVKHVIAMDEPQGAEKQLVLDVHGAGKGKGDQFFLKTFQG